MKKRIGCLLVITVVMIGNLSGCSGNGQKVQEVTPQAVEITTQAEDVTTLADEEVTQTEEETTKKNKKKKKDDTAQNDTNLPTAAEAPTWSAVSEAEAKNIALKDAGVKEKKTSNLFVTMDFDDGKQVYDVEFNVGRTEYEYTIDATSGKILDKDADFDD